MEFIKALVEKEIIQNQERVDFGSYLRQFEPIQVREDVWLSIQASYAHYCTPRTTYEDLTIYSHWEIALFNTDDFIRVTDVLPEFRSLAEIELYEAQVYAYVPVDLVEELYLALKK